MSAIAVAAALCVLVAASWLAAAGFARLASPLDRLHCVAFLNVAGGAGLVAAALLGDGISVRSGKIVLMVVLMVLAASAGSHAIGRALLLRGSAPEARDEAYGAEAPDGGQKDGDVREEGGKA